jgi:hypothetical protein
VDESRGFDDENFRLPTTQIKASSFDEDTDNTALHINIRRSAVAQKTWQEAKERRHPMLSSERDACCDVIQQGAKMMPVGKSRQLY